ncbi:MAG: hypothetical protein R3F49_08220 [Planctomycetota bacterium]
MQVLIVGLYSRWTPHLETDLELAENHLRAGDTVTQLSCERDLEACDIDPTHSVRACVRCIGRRNAGLRALSGPLSVRRFPSLLTADDRLALAQVKTRFESMAALRAYRFGSFDVGFAVQSSIIWARRDSDLELAAVADDVARFMRSACAMYLAVKRYLSEQPTDRVYVFNGRMAPMRAALRACQELGVECVIHERGCDPEHYSLHVNALPHDIANTERMIRAAWDAPAPDRNEKVRIATAWYDQRSNGGATSWISFTESQERSSLPQDWDPTRRNLTVFTTSEFEFAAISDEWSNPVFADNTAGLCDFVRAVAGREGVHVYLRMHPNLKGLDNASTRALRALSVAGATVLAPESKVCSYALMGASEKVVVTGSSVGIEAAFRGVPALLAGKCYYRDLGAVHLPATFDELVEMALARDLPVLDREGALMYGYYMATFGHRFRHFAPRGLFDGEFKGERIKASRAAKALWPAVLRARALVAPRPSSPSDD